jgi:hypothetical protein
LIGQERSRFLNRRNHAGQIEPDAANKIGIGANGSRRANGVLLEESIDALMKRGISSIC